MFSLLSSFQFCPPLKNDGRGELRFGGTVNDFSYKKRKCLNRKLSPLVGESVNRQVDERGKREEKRKNDSDLCTQTCPYRLAGSALPSEFGGS
ncbi:MAG: hypothetical protein E6293_03985 [Dialister sp.]|nr:hypothetical protein [Dialister sp.]